MNGLSGEKCLSCLVACKTVPVLPGDVDTATHSKALGLLLSVLWPWLWAYLGVPVAVPGAGAQRSLCPAPQYYRVSLLLGVAETGLLAESWHHSALPAVPLPWPLLGSQGETAGASQLVGAFVPRGLMPRGMGSALPLELRPQTLWFCR